MIAVRQYTIRHTSYGPPRDKLRFILHKVDWQGVQRVHVGHLQPLHWNEGIGAVLKQLHNTRAHADRRCFALTVEPETDEGAMAGAVNEAGGAPASESTPQSQAPPTQMPYDTQVAHPIRARHDTTEPQFLGVNRMEPVLAGSTRREEIQSHTANSEYEKQMKLLGLLFKGPKKGTKKPSGTSTKGFVRSAFETQRPSIEQPLPVAPRPLEKEEQGLTKAGAETKSTSQASPGQPRQLRRDKPISPAVAKSTIEASTLDLTAKVTDLDDIDMTASECSWMKGLIFDHDSLQVPPDQQRVLQKAESWFKPQAGVIPFQDGNIPIQLFRELSRLADEKAAAEGDSDMDSEMDIDPSPDSVLEASQTSPKSVLQVTQDGEITTSQVSWSVSPSPEPPQRPARFREGLPPDSSFEGNPLPADNTSEKQAKMPQQQSPRPISIDSSNENEPIVPPSSPPVVELASDSDDDIEMETLVPQGLGEDAVEGARPQDIERNLASSASSVLKPVVQVEQTPYAKSKHSRHSSFADPHLKQQQTSSADLKQTSYTSIIYNTCNETTSSSSTNQLNGRQFGINNDLKNDLNLEREIAAQQRGQAQQGSLERMEKPNDQEVHMDRIPSITRASLGKVAEGNQTRTPVSAQSLLISSNSSSMQLSPIDAALPEHPHMETGLTKRKLAESPSKDNRRHSKRREIKIVGFGGDSSRSRIDQKSTLHEERAELLRKLREERKSSTSFENRPGAATKPGMHQYASEMELDSAEDQTSNVSSRAMSPRHRSLYEDPTVKSVSSPHSKTSTVLPHIQPQIASGPKIEQQAPPAATVLEANVLTVFQTFKAAYPEYTGDIRHFQGQCTQMYKLDQEDKMVPKWQWDDFIIRNRTDYKNYALECVDRGENPEPYYRFYKDAIRGTLYRKGIIESKDTLLKCLKELGVHPSTQETLRQPQKSPRKKKKRSRGSLPGAFNQQRKPSRDLRDDAQQNRPRHSFPASSHDEVQTSNQTLPGHKSGSPVQLASNRNVSSSRSTTKPNLLQRLSSNKLSSARISGEGTGDPFRDYYFAVQRTTSWTGSTKVSPSNQSDGSGQKG